MNAPTHCPQENPITFFYFVLLYFVFLLVRLVMNPLTIHLFVRPDVSPKNDGSLKLVVDNWSRHRPVLGPVFGSRVRPPVGQALDRALNGTPGPRSITVDHGTGFQSRALEEWAYRRGVQLDC